MYIISQEDYERIQQNKEGNLEIVPANAEPPSVSNANKPVEVKEISDGVTTTEFQKDKEAIKEKINEKSTEVVKQATAEAVTKNAYKAEESGSTTKKIIKITVVSGCVALLLYLIFFWKPKQA